jgi:tetratricopeptide (TPR) repeat protein
MYKVHTFFFIWFCVLATACGNQNHDTPPLHPEDDPHKGLGIFFESIRKYPDSIKVYEQLIDTLANRGLFAEAASWCDSAITREPDFAAGWLLAKGDLYRMAKLYDSATTAYRQYLQIFPDDEQVLLNLANTYAEKGDATCLQLCSDIAQMYPTKETRANTAFIAGIYFNTTGQFAGARKWFDSAIALQYTFTEAWMERGYSFFDEGNWKEAEKNFRQLTDINVSNPEAWYWLAKSTEAGGDTEKAIEYYARAYSLDRKLTDARRAIERLRKK